MTQKIIFFIIFSLAGKIWAQEMASDASSCESRGNSSSDQISTLIPLNFEMANEGWLLCHPERSEGTDNDKQFLRVAQDDTTAAEFPHNTTASLSPQLAPKDPVIAWLISFPAGMLGLHRAYLGADLRTVLLYVATAGGVFGIVPMIDWILLLKGIQTGDISKYTGNRKFIMWL